MILSSTVPTNEHDDAIYRLLIDAMNDYAIVMLDPRGVVLTWNTGAERLKGYSAADALNGSFSRFYTDEDISAGLPARSLEVAARDGRFEDEGWRVRRDGARFWSHAVIERMQDANGSLIGFAKITHDLTERREAQLSLERSEEQLRALITGVTDYAIFLLDSEGIISSWNLGAQRSKGYLADEIIGQNFATFYTAADQASGCPQRALETAARDGRFEAEGWRVRKDGSQFWAHVIIDAIRTPEGAIRGFAKVTRDITERRSAQHLLEHTQQALIQSQKMDALGRLTGGVAHDFNNLLSAVIGNVEFARGLVSDDARIAGLLDNALKGARRGAVLTKRMLVFSRSQQLCLEALDLHDLVRGTGDLLEAAISAQSTIEIRFPLRLPAILADANQLELAVLNLVMNASDAMPAGGSIILSAKETEVLADHATQLAPGRYVRLTVTDFGDGMDEATVARATEPFFTTKGIGKGTGLGLSMVYGLVEQSGGRLVIRSELGKGTGVELWLPTSSAAAVSEAAVVPTGTSPGTPYRLLIVDDDVLVQRYTSAIAANLGHTVIDTTFPLEALAIIKDDRTIDLMITDHAMPKMTGSELARAVRAERPDLPILLATGYVELPPGANLDLPRLDKPFGKSELAQAISTIMGTRAPIAAPLAGFA